VDPAEYAEAARKRAERIAGASPVRSPSAAAVSDLDFRGKVVALYLPPAVSEQKQALAFSVVKLEVERTFPSHDFEFVAHQPPMFDGWLGETYFTVPKDYQPTVKTNKGVKRDLLSGCCSALREAARVGAHLIIEEGQGAVVAAALARPRVVEHALFSRSIQADEGASFSAAWHNIRAVASYGPRLFGVAKAERLFEAYPALLETAQPGEEFHPTAVILPDRGPTLFAATFAARMSLSTAKHLGELVMPSLVGKPSFRFGRQSTGTCSCGRRALILARCVHCAREDIRDDRETQAAHEEQPREELCEGDPEVAAVTAPGSWLGGTAYMITASAIIERLEDCSQGSGAA